MQAIAGLVQQQYIEGICKPSFWDPCVCVLVQVPQTPTCSMGNCQNHWSVSGVRVMPSSSSLQGNYGIICGTSPHQGRDFSVM